MGAIVPTITGLTSTISAVENLVGTVRSFGDEPRVQAVADNSAALLRAQQELALKQLKQQQAAGERDALEQAALDRAKIQADSAAAGQQRIAALRRAVARQRAAYGAQGIGADDGSAEAVLLGLYEESDTDRMERERLDDIRNRALDQAQDNEKKLNVLQVSQLREKQKLERIANGLFE